MITIKFIATVYIEIKDDMLCYAKL